MRGLWFIDALVRLFVAAGKVHTRESGRQVPEGVRSDTENVQADLFFPVRNTGTINIFFF